MVGLAVTPIDLEPFRRGDPAVRSRVAADIDQACRSTGFLQVVGHGVDERALRRMLDRTAEFFDRPITEKERCRVADLSANRGYAAEGSEALAYSLGDDVVAPDLFEAFNAGWDRSWIDPDYLEAHRRFFAPNVWPTAPPDLAAVWADYQAEIGAVADHLLSAFALALDIDEKFFIDRTRRAIVTTRAINYQRRPGRPAPVDGQMRMGAHTDYGVLTILNADDAPGLEVFHHDQWLPVTVPPGALMVNIGDMLATWTNDRWVSTLHRVVPPNGPGPSRRRSVAQFFEADPDCLIECLPSCTGPDRPPKHRTITAGDYLLAKLMGPREMRTSEIDPSPLP